MEKKIIYCRHACAAFVLFILFLLRPAVCCAVSFEFVNRDISEILYSISLFRGFPITEDDTVRGVADFRFAGGDFDSAFDAFLTRSRLFVEKKEKSWIVSRVHFEKTSDGAESKINDKKCECLFALDAYDVPAALIFERVSMETGVCITYETLPVEPICVHSGFCSVEELIKRIAYQCAGFEVAAVEKDDSESSEKVFRIVRNSRSSARNQLSGGLVEFNKNEEGFWSCDVADVSLSYALESAFSKAKKQFCVAGAGEGKIIRAKFENKSFDEIIKLLCNQSGADSVLSENIYYIVPLKEEKIKSSCLGKSWRSCRLTFIGTEIFSSIASQRFPQIETILIPNSNVVLYCASDSESADFISFAVEADKPVQSHLVKLQYLRTSDFLSHLPPFIEKSSVIDSGSGDSFYFTGTEESYKHLLEELPKCDKPVTRINYDLLIIQYQHSDGSEWTPSFRIDRLSPGDLNGMTADLGSVLDFNLDVVGAFGLNFAAELQTAITASKAHVFANTTLNGVNGSTISFQNTNTYRYRDNNLDPDTGEPIYSGVTREITSGLKLEVTGIVSGDGMITSKITASVSRQGADVSSTTGNPPATSEKVITTEVRARSGEPVVLSGLIQNETEETVSRTPLLSRIPLLGYLFKSKTKSNERTELVIYLVPGAEQFEQEKKSVSDSELCENEQKEMVRLYKEFVNVEKN